MAQPDRDDHLDVDIQDLAGLARALRELRRRHARQRRDTTLTYRDLAASSGYAHSVIGAYFKGEVLPPTDRLDVLVQLLGASGEEQHAFAAARDRIEEQRRRPAAAVEASALTMPHQLPGTIRHFVGRKAELTALAGLVDESGRQRRSPVVVTIDGMAGVGKTALALHWAHQIAEQFPDGQLHVSLRGFDPLGEPVESAEAIRGLLDAFGVPTQRIPPTLAGQVGLYRSLLADRQVLVVLDNARAADQVQDLLPGSASCLTIVTSRNSLTGLIAQGSYPLTLDMPTVEECRQLLTGRLDNRRTCAEPQAVDDLIRLCGRLPLALAVTAARAATHPDFPLATLAAELKEAETSPDAWPSTDVTSDLQAALSCSYRNLSAASARMFRLLGLHQAPDISLPAAASLAGLTRSLTRRLLLELTSAHLLTEHAPGRFAFHDLLRACAAQKARAVDSEAERRAAVHRLLDHYLHTGYAADRLIDPHRQPIVLAPAAYGTIPEEIRSDQQALIWFETEYKVLLAAIAHAAASGFDRHAWQIPWTLADFFDRKGYWKDWVLTHQTALAATQRAEDPEGQARIRRGLGNASTQLASYAEARTHMEHALELCRQIGDEAGQAHTHLNLGWVCEQQTQYHDATDHADEALSLYRKLGNRSGEAQALGSAGWCQALEGQIRQALESCERALSLHQELGDRHGIATTLDSLGFIYHHSGDTAEAVKCYQQSLKLYVEVGDRYEEAATLTRLGETYQSIPDPARARSCWQEALSILDNLRHPDADHLIMKLGALSDAPQ